MSTRSIADVVETLRHEGVVTVEGIFSAREMATLRMLGDQTMAAVSRAESYKGRPIEQLVCRGANDTIFYVWDFYEICEDARPFTRHPAILDVLRALWGDEPISFGTAGIFFDKVVATDSDFAWHQDSYFMLVPAPGITRDPMKYWGRLGRFHVLPTQMAWTEDLHRSNVVVRINIDAQVPENGCLRVIPGSHRCGPFELTGGLDEYIKAHEADAIDCVAGEGSVTFHYPTIVHSSEKNTHPHMHRRAASHRFRRAALQISGWNWPPDLIGPEMSVFAQDGFERYPFPAVVQRR